MFAFRSFWAHTALLLILLVVFAPVCHSAEKPVRMKPQEARKHVGQPVIVKMEVKASKHSLHRKTVYLDSETDFHDEKNLGIAISAAGIEDIRKSHGVEKPAEFYLHKVIEVTGKVVLREARPYIDINQADQIKVIPQEK